MSEAYEGFHEDMDALHILPLAIIPLKTESLKQARLVKNAQLEGAVELFSGQSTGSGQISPEELAKIFDFSGDRKGDLEIVRSLSELSSYDVYSLRRELRHLGIPVDQQTELRLSDQKVAELADYMRVFTRPLIAAVYGSEREDAEDFDGLLELFTSPDKKQARDNLRMICKKLDIKITDIPAFLEDYGDVYLSLAYYRHCLDQNLPIITSFCDVLPEITQSNLLKDNIGLLQTCRFIENRLDSAVTQIAGIIETFRVNTENMWEDLSADRFDNMVGVIHGYQTKLGGALCALHVKMKLWSDMFPHRDVGGLQRRAEFIMTHMRQGIDRIEEIDYDELRPGRGRKSA